MYHLSMKKKGITVIFNEIKKRQSELIKTIYRIYNFLQR